VPSGGGDPHDASLSLLEESFASLSLLLLDSLVLSPVIQKKKTPNSGVCCLLRRSRRPGVVTTNALASFVPI
jgi:hypothetical protein